MILRAIGIAFLCFCILACFGCSTSFDSQSPVSSLEPQSTYKFSDIPVPIGLKPLPQSSYSFQSSGVRVGVLQYRGKGNAEQIIAFYKEQMPMYNWSLINITEYGQRLMNFERESESCIIALQPKGSSITVIISLGPKSSNLTKKQKSQKTLDK
jgi:hypothetical protein